jgi:hypothetical protein
MVASECNGGGLILYELGIIVEGGNGTCTAFASSRITHANEHFIGKRTSLVFHVDRAFNEWCDGGRNGWENHNDFNYVPILGNSNN